MQRRKSQKRKPCPFGPPDTWRAVSSRRRQRIVARLKPGRPGRPGMPAGMLVSTSRKDSTSRLECETAKPAAPRAVTSNTSYNRAALVVFVQRASASRRSPAMAEMVCFSPARISFVVPVAGIREHRPLLAWTVDMSAVSTWMGKSFALLHWYGDLPTLSNSENSSMARSRAGLTWLAAPSMYCPGLKLDIISLWSSTTAVVAAGIWRARGRKGERFNHQLPVTLSRSQIKWGKTG